MGSEGPESARRRFVMARCLGRGGFGEVYEATMHSPGGLQTPVAVKVLRSGIDGQSDAVQRLRDEARMLSHLNHPTILKVYDLVQLDERIALVTEYVDGADLDSCDGISVRALLQAISAVASALDAALHTRSPRGIALQLVHRDIKPSNIRIGRHGQVKLLDFGIARSDVMTREARTDSDLVVGSMPYMAPERFVEDGTVAASDVFSLGCTLYEVLAGDRFFGEGQLRVISGLALDPLKFQLFQRERLDELELDKPLRTLIEDCLGHDHTERPTASEVARRCEALADELDGPGLTLWAGDHDWPAPLELDAPMVGQTIVESVLLAPEPEHEPEPEAPPPPPEPVEEAGSGRLAVGAVLLGGTSFLAVLVVGGLLLALVLAVASGML